jgi:hypothetical protein
MSQKKHDHMWPSFQEASLEKEVGELISQALRKEYEREPSPMKKISKKTGIAPATIKKWYTGRKPPSLGHFLMIVLNYPEILKASLDVVGHGYLTAYVRPITGENTKALEGLFASKKPLAANVPINRDDPINLPDERQNWFLILLKHTRKGHAKDIAAKFRVSLKTARRDIRVLKMAGKIRFVGAKKTGSYKIISK